MGNAPSQIKAQDEQNRNDFNKPGTYSSPNSFETSDETLSEKENDLSFGESGKKKKFGISYAAQI